MKVYKAISEVMKILSKNGITKDRKNIQQGFSFRGIDDVYNALALPLADAGLVILPRMISRNCEERVTQKGGTLFYVTVEAEFDFVAAEDGSKHTVKTFGEAMDSGDKATNKAMSAAFKYAAFQAFCIPTEGENDADATTYDNVAPKEQHQGGKEFPASEKQINLIKSLCARKNYEPLSPLKGITGKQASALIEKLNAMPDIK
jgi:ERF superfamily